MTPIWLVLVIYVLAVARLTRFVNFDVAFDPFRIAVARRFGPESTWVYFLGCPWCVGLWIAIAAAGIPVRLMGMDWWAIFPVGLAASYLVGLLAPLSSDEDMDIETVEAD